MASIRPAQLEAALPKPCPQTEGWGLFDLLSSNVRFIGLVALRSNPNNKQLLYYLSLP